MSASLGFSIPLPSQRNGGHLRKAGVLLKKPMKAMAAAQGRENLDHLQKANNRQPQTPPQPKKRVAQVVPVGIWDRFPTARTVQQMMDTMERIMEDPIGYPSLSEENGGGSYRRGRTPWEIKEGEEEYKMRFDMPGMTKGDVKVWVEEKMLVVKAEKEPKKSSQGEEQREEEEWSAKSYGRYNSRIALPDNVEAEKIKAEVKDGVLYITIPKVRMLTKVLDIEVK
ncbi:small heat shock protein, chloroplastic-like [Magnolia sinica]|uniref:small heat shock protein, chloroplastic-like n=1 Tax=Magnolia sinica TaxID=86752 RepID=UPI00265B6257|nr:small heat shock protein, chloroplastic-like [Magnolia sinica]